MIQILYFPIHNHYCKRVQKERHCTLTKRQLSRVILFRVPICFELFFALPFRLRKWRAHLGERTAMIESNGSLRWNKYNNKYKYLKFHLFFKLLSLSACLHVHLPASSVPLPPDLSCLSPLRSQFFAWSSHRAAARSLVDVLSLRRLN